LQVIIIPKFTAILLFMTALELIQLLSQLAPDTKIIIRGYEDGYNDILELKARTIIPHHNQKDWYYGEYEDFRANNENLLKSNAIELWGKNT
jgi:hypothetical protein